MGKAPLRLVTSRREVVVLMPTGWQTKYFQEILECGHEQAAHLSSLPSEAPTALRRRCQECKSLGSRVGHDASLSLKPLGTGDGALAPQFIPPKKPSLPAKAWLGIHPIDARGLHLNCDLCNRSATWRALTGELIEFFCDRHAPYHEMPSALADLARRRESRRAA